MGERTSTDSLVLLTSYKPVKSTQPWSAPSCSSRCLSPWWPSPLWPTPPRRPGKVSPNGRKKARLARRLSTEERPKLKRLSTRRRPRLLFCFPEERLKRWQAMLKKCLEERDLHPAKPRSSGATTTGLTHGFAEA